ncbi:hypothetical protein BFJ68_g17595 [Fusarium oxysporum]|uniref:Uncharacterized protein n=1 Tax=Fusarium oxysporum TaxID=5507 RepID=A0A420NNA9_FUSOX|nr:hypothetical protein BFJ68_g17595 [Fusarium oxysporum]
MHSLPKRPTSYVENNSRRDGMSIFATDEIMLLPHEPHKTPRSQSPDLARDTTEPRKAGRKLFGLPLAKRKSDNFWKAWEMYRQKPWRSTGIRSDGRDQYGYPELSIISTGGQC